MCALPVGEFGEEVIIRSTANIQVAMVRARKLRVDAVGYENTSFQKILKARFDKGMQFMKYDMMAGPSKIGGNIAGKEETLKYLQKRNGEGESRIKIDGAKLLGPSKPFPTW